VIVAVARKGGPITVSIPENGNDSDGERQNVDGMSSLFEQHLLFTHYILITNIMFSNIVGFIGFTCSLKNKLIFTTLCTLVKSAVLRSHVVCLSVRASVCNVGGL